MKTSLTDDEIAQALCADMDNDLFYLNEEDSANRHKIKAVKKICEGCAIKFQCLEVAMNNEEYGIWGGTTERDRWRMRRRIVRELSGRPRRTVSNGAESNKRRAIEAAEAMTKAWQQVDKKIIEKLPDDVKSLVRLRLANPTLALAELGLLMNPAMTKDQVSGKLRRALGKING